MSRFCPLFSGSTGNSTYIACGDGAILIDAGVSAKALSARLCDIGAEPGRINAVFVSHQHTDHTCGLRVFASKFHIPVYASVDTAAAIADSLAGVDLRVLDSPVCVGGIEVSRFDTSHDCAGSSGFVAELPDGRRIATCTDLGTVTDTVRGALKGCDLIMFESNHDVMMLQNNPKYPYQLKRRILSDKGHLSNTCSAAELPDFIKNGTTRIVLAHLSRENNHPSLAESVAVTRLDEDGFERGSDYILKIAKPSGNEMTVL